MKTCVKCKHWSQGHGGMWDNTQYGTCYLLTLEKIETANFKGIAGIVDGCVNVKTKMNGFEFVTGANFGCIHFLSE